MDSTKIDEREDSDQIDVKEDSDKIGEEDRLFIVNGESYTESEIISILHEQIPRLKKYAHFSDAVIEFV